MQVVGIHDSPLKELYLGKMPLEQTLQLQIWLFSGIILKYSHRFQNNFQLGWINSNIKRNTTIFSIILESLFRRSTAKNIQIITNVTRTRATNLTWFVYNIITIAMLIETYVHSVIEIKKKTKKHKRNEKAHNEWSNQTWQNDRGKYGVLTCS